MARVVFLQKLWYEYHGVMAISSLLKKNGHKVALFIGNKADDFLSSINDKDIIAFSTMTGWHHWVLKVASQIKEKKNITVVLGGTASHIFPGYYPTSSY